MAIIDNVLKKYSKKGSTKRVSLSLKIKQNLNEDLDFLAKYLGISKSKLIEDIIEASGISKKVDELKENNNTNIDTNANSNQINADNSNNNDNNTKVNKNIQFSNFR